MGLTVPIKTGPQLPVTLPVDHLNDFLSWLIKHGWKVQTGIAPTELNRAVRRGAWLFINDHRQPGGFLLFDIAAREAERFMEEVKNVPAAPDF